MNYLPLLQEECIALCFLTCFASTKARTDAFHRNHEPLVMCVCLRTSEAEKSINPCFKEYKNDRFMSVKQGWLPTLTKIQNKPYILVKNCTFMPKTQPAGALFHLLWSLVANSPEIGKISFCILILGIFSHHKELSLDPSSAYCLYEICLKFGKKHKFSNRL
jgi:hypothetical protein